MSKLTTFKLACAVILALICSGNKPDRNPDRKHGRYSDQTPAARNGIDDSREEKGQAAQERLKAD